MSQENGWLKFMHMLNKYWVEANWYKRTVCIIYTIYYIYSNICDRYMNKYKIKDEINEIWNKMKYEKNVVYISIYMQ